MQSYQCQHLTFTIICDGVLRTRIHCTRSLHTFKIWRTPLCLRVCITLSAIIVSKSQLKKQKRLGGIDAYTCPMPLQLHLNNSDYTVTVKSPCSHCAALVTDGIGVCCVSYLAQHTPRSWKNQGWQQLLDVHVLQIHVWRIAIHIC